MKHTITITHEVEAESWDLAVEAILRSDSPVDLMTRCAITNSETDLMEVNQKTLRAAAEKVRDEMDGALHGTLRLFAQLPTHPQSPSRALNRTPLGTIQFDGYRLVSTKQLRWLLRTSDSEARPVLEQAMAVMQKSAQRGNQKAIAAIASIAALLEPQ